jgi:hypothetical protein
VFSFLARGDPCPPFGGLERQPASFFFSSLAFEARARAVTQVRRCVLLLGLLTGRLGVAAERAFALLQLFSGPFGVVRFSWPPAVSDEGAESKKRPQEGEPEGANDVATKKSAVENKAVLEKAVSAIRALRSHTGSSIKAIQKQLGGDVDTATLKEALKSGVASAVLAQNKQSFLVKGESYPDPTPRIEIVGSTPAPDAAAAKCKNGDFVAVSYTGEKRSKSAQVVADSHFFLFCFRNAVRHGNRV